jgi:hypothetical protein
MNEVCSVACPMTAGNASFAATSYRDASRSLVRWIVLGAASLVLFVLAAAHSASVGAAVPATTNGNYCINFYTCYTTPTYTAPVYTGPTYTMPAYTAPTYVAPATAAAPATTSASGYPANAVISTYFDPRYGEVSVVTDASGNLIDINAQTGQRIYPYLPDNGYGFAPGFLGANYVNGNIAFNGYNFANNYGYLNGNYANFNGNAFPAGGTVVGGAVFYNDNRFCGDGKVAFVPNQGYFCQNGGPLVTNGVNTINCNNFFLNGCGIWRGFEADTTATTPAAAVQPQQVTTFAATAAPAAPVVAPAAPVLAPAAPVVAPAAPVSAKIAVGVPGIAPVGGVQIEPSSR